MTLTDLDDDIARQGVLIDANLRFMWRHTVEPLITPEVVNEHRADPLGHHSPVLDLVLAFLRRDPIPTASRSVVVILEPEKRWAIGDLSRQSGLSVHVRPQAYESVEEIEHAIFLERLEAARLAFGADKKSAAST